MDDMIVTLDDLKHVSSTGVQRAKSALGLLQYTEGLVRRNLELSRLQLEMKLRRLEARSRAELKELVDKEKGHIEHVIDQMIDVMSRCDALGPDPPECDLLAFKYVLDTLSEQIERKRMLFQSNKQLTDFIDESGPIGNIAIRAADEDDSDNDRSSDHNDLHHNGHLYESDNEHDSNDTIKNRKRMSDGVREVPNEWLDVDPLSVLRALNKRYKRSKSGIGNKRKKHKHAEVEIGDTDDIDESVGDSDESESESTKCNRVSRRTSRSRRDDNPDYETVNDLCEAQGHWDRVARANELWFGSCERNDRTSRHRRRTRSESPRTNRRYKMDESSDVGDNIRDNDKTVISESPRTNRRYTIEDSSDTGDDKIDENTLDDDQTVLSENLRSNSRVVNRLDDDPTVISESPRSNDRDMNGLTEDTTMTSDISLPSSKEYVDRPSMGNDTSSKSAQLSTDVSNVPITDISVSDNERENNNGDITKHGNINENIKTDNGMVSEEKTFKEQACTDLNTDDLHSEFHQNNTKSKVQTGSHIPNQDNSISSSSQYDSRNSVQLKQNQEQPASYTNTTDNTVDVTSIGSNNDNVMNESTVEIMNVKLENVKALPNNLKASSVVRLKPRKYMREQHSSSQFTTDISMTTNTSNEKRNHGNVNSMGDVRLENVHELSNSLNATSVPKLKPRRSMLEQQSYSNSQRGTHVLPTIDGATTTNIKRDHEQYMAEDSKQMDHVVEKATTVLDNTTQQQNHVVEEKSTAALDSTTQMLEEKLREKLENTNSVCLLIPNDGTSKQQRVHTKGRHGRAKLPSFNEMLFDS